jgi:hypothetical protein
LEPFADEPADQRGLGQALFGSQAPEGVVEILLDHDLQSLHG